MPPSSFTLISALPPPRRALCSPALLFWEAGISFVSYQRSLRLLSSADMPVLALLVQHGKGHVSRGAALPGNRTVLGGPSTLNQT